MSDQSSDRQSRSHLFTVRVWAEHLDVGWVEWRGKVQHIRTNEAHYFRTWQQLIEYMTANLPTEDNPTMTTTIPTTGVHHVTLTVSDVRRSQRFYTELLGFNYLTDFGLRTLLHNGTVLLGVGPAPDPVQASANDRFNENRIGLDHFSLSVAGMADLEAAVALLDANGVPHGDIVRLEPFGIALLAFRDPDNIQVELTAPLA